MYRIAGLQTVQTWLTPVWTSSAKAVLAIPTAATANLRCRNGVKREAWAYPAMPAAKSASATVIPDAFWCP